MRLFVGLSRSDYEEVFRTVGALLDEREWTNATLLEVEDGLVIQATAKLRQRDDRPHLETYLLTDNDLERLMREAVLRRQNSALERGAPPPHPRPMSRRKSWRRCRTTSL